MKAIHAVALFRLSVLGPLASRERLERGELKQYLKHLAAQRYEIPGSKRVYLSEKTIESWFYRWQKGGIEALEPQRRCDRGQSKLPLNAQEALLAAKRENPKRSLDELKRLLEDAGLAAQGELSRSSIHRLLKAHGLSRPTGSGAGELVERRSYVAQRAGDIWYGDVMHGPRILVDGQERKTYLVSLMDDASRLITHSAFCLGETALAVEGVLKQALLRRGPPKRLVIDNGAAYRARSLQGICARLSIRLIYCRPYMPEGKGKIERWHRVVRAQLLSELTAHHLQSLDNLNGALWAWLEQVYHQRVHSALDGKTPLVRWQQDLESMRSLGPFAADLDELFYHRHTRKVRKDGTVSFDGQRYEVSYELSGRRVELVVDPHQQRAVSVESSEGEPLGSVTPLDLIANNTRRRQGSTSVEEQPAPTSPSLFNAIEQAEKKQQASLVINPSTFKE
jgi:transposase InsO family protein